MIVFIGSHNNFTAEKAENLAAAANRENVSIDIVAFGDDVNNVDVLQDFVESLNMRSYFVRAKTGNMILSDIVLSSNIGPGRDSAHDVLDPYLEDDPDVAFAIRQSINQAHEGDDSELQAAIRASLEEAQSKGYGLGEDEDELMEAIRLSLMEDENENSPKNTNLNLETYVDYDNDDQEEKNIYNQQSKQDDQNLFNDDDSFKTFKDACDNIEDPEVRKALFESFIFKKKDEEEQQIPQFFYDIHKSNKDSNEKDNEDDNDDDDPLLKALLETVKENEQNNQRKK